LGDNNSLREISWHILQSMKKITPGIQRLKNELIFQLILHVLVFNFYVIDNCQGSVQYDIEFHSFIYFLNYVIANWVISYLFLPKFFYTKQFVLFFLLVFSLVTFVVVFEQIVLDSLFFPCCSVFELRSSLLCLGEVFPILAILSGFKFGWDAINKQKEVEALKTLARESEVAFLHSQINPHFLFNHLNNLYSYALQGSPKTSKIILEMSGILRYMLYECREEIVPLQKEIDHLIDFINLHELQIEERGKVVFSVNNIPADLKIAPLILNVFVENSFKHSQLGKSDEIVISVNIEVDEQNRLFFTCVNNYEASPANSTGSKGIGLANVKRRLDLLYPYRHRLVLTRGENQFEVQLSIQL
jgi:hypothetical protein